MEASKKRNSSWSYAGLLPDWAIVEDGRPIRDYMHSPSLLIWAKVTGHPWWPALLRPPKDKGKCRRPEKPTHIWIYNLGANNFSEVDPTTQILPYSYHNTQKFGTPIKLKPNYRKEMKKAMDEADAILAIDKRGLDLGLRPGADSAVVAPPPPGVINDEVVVQEEAEEAKEDKEIAEAEEKDDEWDGEGESRFGEE